MAGGIWLSQNKVRAGAYINFKAVNRDAWDVNERNVMTMPVEMDWGEENKIIELTADQLIDGSCEKIIGYTASDKESLVFRQALQNCYKALIFRLNSKGGDYARHTEALKYTIEAKCKGICGNKVSFEIAENKADNTKLDFITYYRDNQKDLQTVSSLVSIRKLLLSGELKDNDWLNIRPLIKQPEISLEGENFTIVAKANPKTYIGEEGNNLKLNLAVTESGAVLKIFDDRMELAGGQIPLDTEFTYEDFPENDFVIWEPQTAGFITSEDPSQIASAVPVKDPYLEVKEKTFLTGGVNGSSSTSTQAKAQWGGLTAEAIPLYEAGNDLAFTIQEQEPEAEANDDIPFIIDCPEKIMLPKASDPSQRPINATYITIKSKTLDDWMTYTFDEFDIEKVEFRTLLDKKYYKIPMKWAEFKPTEERDKIEVAAYAGYIDPKDFPEQATTPDGILVHFSGTVIGKGINPETKQEETNTYKYCKDVIFCLVTYITELQPVMSVHAINIIEPSPTKQRVETFLKIENNKYVKWNPASLEILKAENWEITSSTGKKWEFSEALVETETKNSTLSFVITSPDDGITEGEVITAKCLVLEKAFTDGKNNPITILTEAEGVVLVCTASDVPAPRYLSSELQEIEAEEKLKSFTSVVNLENNIGRYVFNEEALDEMNWVITGSEGSKCETLKVEKISETSLKVYYQVVTEGAFVPGELFCLCNYKKRLVTDTKFNVDSEISDSVQVVKVEDPVPPPKETKYEIIINDKTSTVAQIKDLNPEESIQEMVESKKLVNDYIKFGGEGLLLLTINPVQLSGGSSEIDSYTSENGYFAQIEPHNFNCMCLPQEDGKSKRIPIRVKRAAVDLIRDLRDGQGRKCQVVLYNFAGSNCNYEGVISTKQGYKTSDEEINAGIFTAYVAGLTAGSQINKSNTYNVVDSATEILYYEGEKPYNNSQYIALINQGYFLLSKRRDLTIVCEKDIDTLHEPYPTKDVNYSFTKNRVIRTLDEINNTVVSIWEERFVGKVSNNDKGRTLYRVELVKYMRELERLETIQNFDPQKDVSVEQGDKIDAVVVLLAIQVVDSMEKLYMTVNIE